MHSPNQRLSATAYLLPRTHGSPNCAHIVSLRIPSPCLSHTYAKRNTDATLSPVSSKDSVDSCSSEMGFAGTVFLCSLELFRGLKDTIDQNPSWSAHDVAAYQEELESYLLWGTYYGTALGKLDRILTASSRELRDGVLSYIGNISYILCKRMLTSFSIMRIALLGPRLYEIVAQI